MKKIIIGLTTVVTLFGVTSPVLTHAAEATNVQQKSEVTERCILIVLIHRLWLKLVKKLRNTWY